MHYKRRSLQPVCSIEHLETRQVLSAVTVALQPLVVAETEANDTLDQAQDLGFLEATQVHGHLDTSGTDVDWFEFHLSTPSTVTLNTTAGTIGLYNDSHGDINDLRDLIGYRLLAQDTTDETTAGQITRDLAAGTYYVAVSGAGNRYFSPFIADSGLPGTGGDYQLDLVSTPIDRTQGSDPLPLAVDVTSLIVRIDLSAALDFAPTIELTTGGGTDLPLLWTNQNSHIAELQIAPTTPLVPGDYTAVIKDADGQIRLTVAVHVPDATEGGIVDNGNDTPATAINLGNIEQQGLVQISGVIGDDAYYDFSNTDPAFRPGNDVDLYHFSVTSNSPVGFQAEVFAGRISSTLDAGISLYRLDPVSGQLEFVAGNNQSYNPTRATDRKSSLYFDPAVMVALTAGDYYIAVSHGYNTPSPDEFQPGGAESGIFNPEVSHSGSIGENVGPYLLNLQVVSIPSPPEVNSVSIVDQSTLTAPTEFTVNFSEYMNLTSLAFRAFQETSQSSIAGVYIVDAQGQRTFPRLTAFDVNTFSARFKMLDRLAAGTYELHLSGDLGLTNVAGAPLNGNTPGGDYVIRFTVDTSAHGTNGDPLVLTHVEVPGQDDVAQPLGVLFPHELQTGVTIVRDGGAAGNHEDDLSDKYEFQILQQQTYFFFLDGDRLPDGVTITLFDSTGAQIEAVGFLDGRRLSVGLQAGTYTLRVGDWPENKARRLEYQISVNLTGIADDSPPLFSGPGPAMGIRLATTIGPGGGGQAGPGISLPGAGGSSDSSSGGASSGNSGSVSNNGSNPVKPANLDLNGPLQISLPSGLGNLAISSPALNYSAGNRVGAIRNAGGALRQSAGLNAGPRFSSLIRLADGPVGAVSSRTDELSLTMHAMQKLNTLIGATLSTNSALARDDAHSETTERPADDESAAHDADQANADASDSEESLTTTEEEAESPSQATRHGDPAKRVSAVEQAWSTVLVADDTNARSIRHCENDCAFISEELDLHVESVSPPVQAVGIGAFVLQVASLHMQHLTARLSPTRVLVRRARTPQQQLIK